MGLLNPLFHVGSIVVDPVFPRKWPIWSRLSDLFLPLGGFREESILFRGICDVRGI